MTPDPSADGRHMRHALTLAALGQGSVEPNPMVGAVVLDAAGRVVGEGWHQQFGGPHAEVHALAAAGDAARGGTLVVTLEPCCHHGKTPPCTDAVLRSGVKRVVVATADPFPQVAGGGLAILRNAGLAVTVGVCAAEADALNAPFFKLVRTGRPWVVAKWAMTLDGRIATRTGDSKWISGEASRRRVHELRGRVDAVVVGRGTVVADDPRLTARPPGPRTATRVVLSASGDLPERCQLRATARETPVLVFTAAGNEAKLAGWAADGAEVVGLSPSPRWGEGSGVRGDLHAGEEIRVPPGQAVVPSPPTPLPSGERGDRLSIDAVLADLGRRRMTNVLVEGGAGVLGAFADAAAIDEVWAFVAPVVAGGAGALSPVGGRGADRIAGGLRLADPVAEPSGDDLWIRGRVFRGG